MRPSYCYYCLEAAAAIASQALEELVAGLAKTTPGAAMIKNEAVVLI